MLKIQFFLNLVLLSVCLVFVSAKQIQSNKIYGKWVSDKAYDGLRMEITLNAKGNFIEITKDIKGDSIKWKTRSTYKFISNSVIQVDKRQYYKFKFAASGELSFSSTTSKAEVDIPLIYVYSFVRAK